MGQLFAKQRRNDNDSNGAPRGWDEFRYHLEQVFEDNDPNHTGSIRVSWGIPIPKELGVSGGEGSGMKFYALGDADFANAYMKEVDGNGSKLVDLQNLTDFFYAQAKGNILRARRILRPYQRRDTTPTAISSPGRGG
jgi:hypothetical protein